MHRRPRAAGGRGGGRRTSPVRVAALILVALLTVAGGGFLAAALTMEPPQPPQPAAEAAPPGFDPAGGQPADAPTGPDGEPVSLGESVPVRIEIPTIDVDTKIMQLGVDDDNQVEVPPLDKAQQAGWYKYGATPGEIGPAVIIGHVDSYKIGPAVFFYLGELEPGDRIEVDREDGSTATFRVDGVKSFPKDDFPHGLVYGPTTTAQLRVVTCGGRFDKKQRDYPDNIVVFASLVSP